MRLRPAGVRTALWLIGAAAIGLAAWGALSWTLVPTGLDAQVVETSWSEGGPPWKEVHTEDGALTVLTEVYEDMGGEHDLPGQHLDKEPWTRTVVVGGRDVPLDVPWTTWKAVLLVAGLVVVALVRTGRRLAAEPDRVEVGPDGPADDVG